MKKFTCGEYLVKDTSPIGQIYKIQIRKCHEEDCYFVKFSGFNEPQIMTTDEIESEFTFLS